MLIAENGTYTREASKTSATNVSNVARTRDLNTAWAIGDATVLLRTTWSTMKKLLERVRRTLFTLSAAAASGNGIASRG